MARPACARPASLPGRGPRSDHVADHAARPGLIPDSKVIHVLASPRDPRTGAESLPESRSISRTCSPTARGASLARDAISLSRRPAWRAAARRSWRRFGRVSALPEKRPSGRQSALFGATRSFAPRETACLPLIKSSGQHRSALDTDYVFSADPIPCNAVADCGSLPLRSVKFPRRTTLACPTSCRGRRRSRRSRRRSPRGRICPRPCLRAIPANASAPPGASRTCGPPFAPNSTPIGGGGPHSWLRVVPRDPSSPQRPACDRRDVEE